jgi:hypothetical protein
LREQQLWETYPRLFHMATAGSWPSIRERGLLSTAALLDLFEVSGAEREAVECRRRPDSVTIRHAAYGEAVIRDQKPMTDAALTRCVRGISVSDWLKMLNRRVYFWPDEGRLRRLLSARAYAGDEHCMLTLDTRSLVLAHAASITLSRINSGALLYNAPARGPETFQTIPDCPFEDWCRRGSRKTAVAELAVDYSVPDVAGHVIRVERRKGQDILETIWRR